MDIAEVKQAIARIMHDELPKSHHAFFFGSRVSGTASQTADLDVGIEGDGPLSTDILYTIKSRIDALRTLITVDIVDFANLTDEFKAVAKNALEKI